MGGMHPQGAFWGIIIFIDNIWLILLHFHSLLTIIAVNEGLYGSFLSTFLQNHHHSIISAVSTAGIKSVTSYFHSQISLCTHLSISRVHTKNLSNIHMGLQTKLLSCPKIMQDSNIGKLLSFY